MRPFVVGTCSSQGLFDPFRSRHVYTLIDYQGERKRGRSSKGSQALHLRLQIAGAIFGSSQ